FLNFIIFINNNVHLEIPKHIKFEISYHTRAESRVLIYIYIYIYIYKPRTFYFISHVICLVPN
ncbi:MAG: hypothetical protein MCS20_01815, partial [Candidatus Phytoplasma mali]|nr:hypothetical protein [Candidatus Phytoplasma australiense]MBZ7920121.1 hypothetical protein [Candidatus Karelsulcia muelleri]MCG7202126.1 hypothetical protein [Candidatus Phytoplasma mali]MCZ8632639.1 hypothetical protein [Spiroplasma sp. Tabriz.8]